MNKVALITGGSNGIGKGIAYNLAEKGYDIAFTYASNLKAAEEVKAELNAKGVRVEFSQADLREAGEAQKVVDWAHAKMGRIDVMIINAGLDGRHSVLTATQRDYDDFFHMNLRASMMLCGAAARYMIKDKIKGNMIFITSSRGERAYADDFIYGMTKAALRRACESIAIDLSPYGIRANCVAPGATWTHAGAAHETLMNGGVPMGRIGTPEDTADLVAYLVSDKAFMIDGTQIRIDGGLILSGLPEGWAEAKFLDPEWTKRNYNKFMEEYFPEI